MSLFLCLARRAVAMLSLLGASAFLSVIPATASAQTDAACGITTQCQAPKATGELWPTVLWGTCPTQLPQPTVTPPRNVFAPGFGEGFRSEGDAVAYSIGNFDCVVANNGGFYQGKQVCTPLSLSKTGQDTTYWFGGSPSRMTAHYAASFKYLQGPAGSQTCTGVSAFNQDFVGANGLYCPAGWNSAQGDTNYLCYKPLYVCDECSARMNSFGNPIVMGENDKRESHLDWIGAGLMPLRVERFYSSQMIAGPRGGSEFLPLGTGWRTKYHRSVAVFTTPTVSRATLARETGTQFYFKLVAGVYVARAEEKGKLQRQSDGSGATTGWIYQNAENETETYDAAGRLLSLQDVAGRITTLTYNGSGQLSTVTDPLGRTLQFTYNAAGWVSTIQTPDGKTFGYTIDANRNLTTVTYPDTRTRQYLYEVANLPNSLTGVIDENGVRYATFSYDSTYGKANDTQYTGGVNHYAFNVSPQYPQVTDPLGTVRNYQFDVLSSGAYALSSLTEPAASGSGTQWEMYYRDGNGNLTSLLDSGGRNTVRTFDTARNVELTRTEASGKPEQRKITAQWHANWRLANKVAEPLRITTYQFHGDTGVSCAPAGASTALVCTKSVQGTTDASGALGFSATSDGSAARVWSWQYNARGQVTQATGPRTDVADVTSYSYFASDDPSGNYRAGDLASITNAKGQVTSFTQYDGAGRLLRSVDPNGLETLLAYHPRGWLSSRSVGVAGGNHETTSYSFDYLGQLTGMTMPDGSTVAFTFDSAHRLTDVQDGLGNRIHYTLDGMGNRTAEQAYDVNNNPVRAHSRVINALM